MQFGEIFREERYYCNHLFRLMCHKKENGNGDSGLAAILKELKIPEYESAADIRDAQIYTELAVFRDVFAATEDKDHFIDRLYELFLPMMMSQYSGKIRQPMIPSKVREKVGRLHPNKYGGEVTKFGEKDDILFYREFSALFNAKPDFLIIFQDKMLWFEAKFWESFDSNQLKRTENIATLCSSELFSDYFHNSKPIIVLLGSEHRHQKAQKFDDILFLSWEACHNIAEQLLPGENDNYTVKSFRSMLRMK